MQTGRNAMTPSKVADLTIDEFRGLIRAVVIQTLSEMLDDPDEGLELRDNFSEELLGSLAAVETVVAKPHLRSKSLKNWD